jgi:hypothetical protein
MPRPSRAPRLRRPEAFDYHKAIYLCRGYGWFNAQPFSDEVELRECWEQHRDLILTFRDTRDEKMPGADFNSGTRPWAWWVLDQDQEPPHSQYRIIEELGLLQPGEREKAIELARAKWVRHNLGETHTESYREQAAAVSDERLLDAWPWQPWIGEPLPETEDDPEEEESEWMTDASGDLRIRRTGKRRHKCS